MKKQKALFLDRDGVINIDHGYVFKIEDFTFTEGIFTLLQSFIKQEYLLFIVTNQSGIGRGYYRLNDFQKLTKYMLDGFQQKGIKIEDVQYCPHAPKEMCKCRKPHTGMIDNIQTKYNIDLQQSWLIGDKQSDIDLAKNAKIGTSVAISNPNISNASYCFDTILSFKKSIEEGKTILR